MHASTFSVIYAQNNYKGDAMKILLVTQSVGDGIQQDMGFVIGISDEATAKLAISNYQ